MIIILFGLTASGKTYVGDVIERYFDFHHKNADQRLLDDIKKCIAKKGEFYF